MAERPRRIKEQEVDAAKGMDLAALYPSWETGVAYTLLEIVSYEGELYQVMQGHTSQADWLPANLPALYKNIRFTDSGVAVWVQPQGGHDAYQLGAVVSYNDQLWENVTANNVWQPGVYGWIIKS